jgi:hypothetical protein
MPHEPLALIVRACEQSQARSLQRRHAARERRDERPWIVGIAAITAAGIVLVALIVLHATGVI